MPTPLSPRDGQARQACLEGRCCLTRDPPAPYFWGSAIVVRGDDVVPTLIGGAIPLLIAVVFLGIVLAKVPSIPLWMRLTR